MEPGGPGSFQAVKLQRPARATVCSHSTRDVAAMSSIESEWQHSDAPCECLSGSGQMLAIDPSNIAAVGNQAIHLRTRRPASSDLGGSRWTLY
jgi:hypothetical protein